MREGLAQWAKAEEHVTSVLLAPDQSTTGRNSVSAHTPRPRVALTRLVGFWTDQVEAGTSPLPAGLNAVSGH